MEMAEQFRTSRNHKNMNGTETKHEFFAASVSGCETVLCEELRELGFSSVRLNLGGGIPFRGTWEDGWRACLQSRIAQRIQKVMKRFAAPTAEDLYAGVQAIEIGRAHVSSSA